MLWLKLLLVFILVSTNNALRCRSTISRGHYILQKLTIHNIHCQADVQNCITVDTSIGKQRVIFPMCEGEVITGPFGEISGICKANGTGCYETGEGRLQKRVCCCSRDLCNTDNFDLRSGSDTRSLILTCIGCVMAGIAFRLILYSCDSDDEADKEAS